MFCDKCGKEIKERDKFCNSCGAIIGVSEVEDNTRNPQPNLQTGEAHQAVEGEEPGCEKSQEKEEQGNVEGRLAKLQPSFQSQAQKPKDEEKSGRADEEDGFIKIKIFGCPGAEEEWQEEGQTAKVGGDSVADVLEQLFFHRF